MFEDSAYFDGKMWKFGSCITTSKTENACTEPVTGITSSFDSGVHVTGPFTSSSCILKFLCIQWFSVKMREEKHHPPNTRISTMNGGNPVGPDVGQVRFKYLFFFCRFLKFSKMLHHLYWFIQQFLFSWSSVESMLLPGRRVGRGLRVSGKMSSSF